MKKYIHDYLLVCRASGFPDHFVRYTRNCLLRFACIARNDPDVIDKEFMQEFVSIELDNLFKLEAIHSIEIARVRFIVAKQFVMWLHYEGVILINPFGTPETSGVSLFPEVHAL